MIDHTALTVGDRSLLNVDVPPPLLDREDEQNVLAELTYHRARALSAARVCSYRYVPMWFMLSNAIIWRGTGIRIPIIGGPTTPWHWGVFFACGGNLKWLPAVLYFNRIRDFEKVAAAAMGTLIVCWLPVGIARHHAKGYFELNDGWNRYARQHLDDEADGWNTMLAMPNLNLCEVAARREQVLAHPLGHTPGAAQLLHALNTVLELEHIDTDLLETAIKEVRKKEVPKTLSDGFAIKGKLFAEVIERDEKLALLLAHKETLEQIIETSGCREQLNGKMQDIKFKLPHDAMFATELAVQMASTEIERLQGEASFEKDVEKEKAVAEQGKVISAIQETWRHEVNLWDAYMRAVELEWPGESDIDYKVMFVLARYFEKEWFSQSPISQLKSGSRSPNAFYNWADGKARRDKKFTDARYGAVAAVARSMLDHA